MLKLRKLYAEELEKEHLSVLRELGRQIGVKAPAAKNKEELIEEILGVQSGKIKPHSYGKSGAPKKLNVDISEYLIDDNFEYPRRESEYSKLTFCDVDQTFEVEEPE